GRPHEVTLRIADLELDTIRRTVRRAGRTIDLKPKEYALLEFLMQHTDRPLTRSLIIEHVWDIHFDSISNVVGVHINSLRNKIDRGFGVPLIHTYAASATCSRRPRRDPPIPDQTDLLLRSDVCGPAHGIRRRLLSPPRTTARS